jgi:hypothetical protein
MCTPVEFTITRKGRPLMIIDGYRYTQDRRTDDKTYWHCNGKHTTSCNRDPIKISLRKFNENIADRANNTQETTDAVLSPCISKLADQARIGLSRLDHTKRTIQQHRKKK